MEKKMVAVASEPRKQAVLKAGRPGGKEEMRKHKVFEAIDAVDELPGDMPDEMWEAIKGDRDAMGEALRIAVRQTKEEAKRNIERNWV